MFKIQYETRQVTDWLKTEYPDPEDAAQIAKRLIDGAKGELLRTTVVEQDGSVYAEYRRGNDENISGYLA